MIMEQEISKLITAYSQRISDCDTLIESYRKAIKLARSNGESDVISSNRKLKAHEEAKRQAYVQAMYDFDSLLDYVK